VARSISPYFSISIFFGYCVAHYAEWALFLMMNKADIKLICSNLNLYLNLPPLGNLFSQPVGLESLGWALRCRKSDFFIVQRIYICSYYIVVYLAEMLFYVAVCKIDLHFSIL
jgi:hypothetical protein